MPRGWWIPAACAVVAVVLLVALAMRGPATGRAPAKSAAVQRPPAAPPPGRRLKVSVGASPAGSRPEWTLEVRARAGGVHIEKGTGPEARVTVQVEGDHVRCVLRAPGYVGETRAVEIGGGDTDLALVLRRFGRVSGSLVCDGLPVGGALVRLAMAPDSRRILTDLAAEDRVTEAVWSAESDDAGRYSFDRVPPASGYTLVAADFDYLPARAGPLEVEPGEESIADFTLVEGGHLAGRILDSRCAACRGATVHVFAPRKKRGMVMSWLDDARARTDDDGRFVTPALGGGEVRMLKTWLAVDDIQEFVQVEAEVPARGTRDLGTLAPLPGVVLFEAGSAVGEAPFSLTVVVTGDPPGVGSSMVLAGISFDRSGRVRIGGLPPGEGVFSVLNGDGAQVADGRFRTTGRDLLVRIPPFGEPEAESPPPAERLIVDVGDNGEAAIVVLIADGDFVLWRKVAAGAREPVVEPVAPGRYTLHVTAGDRYEQREITQVEGRDLTVSVRPGEPGRSVRLHILDHGKPVRGAKVQIRGFRVGSRGLRVPWAEAGDDGCAVLRGLPPDLTAVTASILDAEGFGRTRTIEIGPTDDVTVDLAGEAPARR